MRQAYVQQTRNTFVRLPWMMGKYSTGCGVLSIGGVAWAKVLSGCACGANGIYCLPVSLAPRLRCSVGLKRDVGCVNADYLYQTSSQVACLAWLGRDETLRISSASMLNAQMRRIIFRFVIGTGCVLAMRSDVTKSAENRIYIILHSNIFTGFIRNLLCIYYVCKYFKCVPNLIQRFDLFI